MRIPGDKRSPFPDECGNRAGVFAEAVRDGEMDLAWSMLSKETRGMRMGVWATKNRVNMQDAYRAGYNSDHPLRAAMLDDFRSTVLSLWPLEDLTDLGISPTSYLDDMHAFAFLPFLMPRPPQVIGELRIGPQGFDGIQFSGQSRFGKHGVELPVTGGAELDLGSKPSAPGAGNQVV